MPNEVHNADGRFVDYLDLSSRNQYRFRICDPPLYDALREIVLSGSRHVVSVRNGNVLPLGTCFYEELLTFDGLGSAGSLLRKQRAESRAAWLAGALCATEGCDVVFLDPDNGLEVRVGPHQLRGPKYAFYGELLPFAQRDQSLVVYHHLARNGRAVDQVRNRLFQLQSRLGRDAFALLYHRGSARAFFVIPAQRYWEPLSQRATAFLETRWSQHFEFVALT